MSTRKIEEMLRNTEYPDFVLKSAKEKLRDELLKEAEKVLQKNKQKKSLLKYIVSTAASVILALFLILEFFPQEVTAKEIAKSLENTYLTSFIKDSVHYVKKLFNVKDKVNSGFVLESWRYGKDLMRLQFKDKNDGKIVSHLIATNHKTYELKESDSRIKLKIKIDICENNDQTTQAKKEKVMENENIKVIIKKLKSNKKGKKRSRILIIKDSPEMMSFSRQIPEYIYTKLKSNPLVKYKGEIFDRSRNMKLDVFEKSSMVECKEFILEYENDLRKKMDWFFKKISDKKIKLNAQNSQSKNEAFPGIFSIKKLKAIEITQIDKDTGKILKVDYSLFDGLELLHQYELVFQIDKFIKYDSSIFNPELYNLK